jgi:integrase
VASKKFPKLCHHRHTERGYINFDGKFHYFKGTWPGNQKDPPQEIVEQYTQACAKISLGSFGREKPSEGIAILDLCERYIQFASKYYVKDGEQTTEAKNTEYACNAVSVIYGPEKAIDFGPFKLKTVIRSLVARGLRTGTINTMVGRIRRLFKWAAGEELLPASVWLNLRSVDGVKRGRGIPESRKVEPVPMDLFEATLPLLPRKVGLMARVHWLIGCRSNEIAALRGVELSKDKDPDLWVFTPTRSKNYASYLVGPKAQEILVSLLEERGHECYLFGTGKGRKPRSSASYRKTVLHVCKVHGLPRWTPSQIRHAAAQEARDSHPRGIEATQAKLGHQQVTTSQIYAHSKMELARDVARRLG